MISITYNVRGGKTLPCTPDELRRARSMVTPESAARLREITAILGASPHPSPKEREHVDTPFDSADSDRKANLPNTPPLRGELEGGSRMGGAEALEAEKKALKLDRPALIPHAECFDNNERKSDNAHPSGLVMFDVDHMKVDIRQFFEDKIKAFVDEWNIALVEISASGDGLHILFEKPLGMTIQESQKWLADLLGVSYDEGTFDLARACFVVGEDYVLYQNDDRLFKETDIPTAELPLYFWNAKRSPSPALPSLGGSREVTPSDGGISTPFPITGALGYAASLDEGGQKNGKSPEGEGLGAFFALKAFDLCLTEAGLTSAEIDIPGERNWHNTLKAILSVGLCQLMDKEHLLGAVKTRMPNYYETEDCRRLVSDFYKNYCDENGRMSLTLRKIYAQAVKSLTPSLSQGEGAFDGTELLPLRGEAGRGLPLPKLPRLLQLLIKAYPEEYRPAVVLSSLVFLGTLLSSLRAYYLDGATHSPSFFCAVSAPQASGKSFTRRLYDLLTAPIKEQDKIGRMLEQEYKDKCKAAKNNRQQPEDPRPMIRLIPATASNAMILKRADYAKGLHLCTYAEEIDTLVKGQKAGAWSQKSDIYRMAFDNAEWGQDYMSDSSYSGQVKLFYNLLVCGTPNAMNRYFTDVEDGLVSRVMFVNLPDMLGAKMPRFGTYTRKDLKEIKETVQKLFELGSTPKASPHPSPKERELVNTPSDSAHSDIQGISTPFPITGEGKSPQGEGIGAEVWINIPRLSDAIDAWLEDKRQEYLQNQDNPALEIFRRRAAVCGFRAGMVAYALYGMKWNVGVGEFAVWVAEHTLLNQLASFGERMNQIMLRDTQEVVNKATDFYSRAGRNVKIFEQLSDEFSDADLIRLRMNIGKGERVDYILNRWWRNGLIEIVKKGVWRKK